MRERDNRYDNEKREREIKGMEMKNERKREKEKRHGYERI